MEVPKPGGQDYFLKIVKGVAGAVPFAGGVLGELLEMVVVPKHQKKMAEWFEYVNSTLEEISDKGIRAKEDIFNDDQFIAVFQKTSKAYADNVEIHKKPIIQAFLKSSITKPIPLDKQLIFLRVIEELTEVQFGILRDVYENETSQPYLYQTALEKKLAAKYAEDNPGYLKLLVKGLTDHHLLSYGSANVVLEGANQWYMRISNIAKELMAFLNEDPGE